MKKVWMILLSLALLLSLPGCAQLDVIGNQAVRSFEAVLAALPGQVAFDEAAGGFSLAAPDGSARLLWGMRATAETPYHMMMELDAEPFVAAGLDVASLPEGMALGGKLRVGVRLGDEEPAFSTDTPPMEAFRLIREKYRDRINYHAEMDHFGLLLGQGNLFEWAKDLETNDKDIVFALDPQLLMEAGVAPEKVEGWVYAKVKVEAASGQMVEVYKFLKPFAIE